MARFILDVANVDDTKEFMDFLLNCDVLLGEIVRIKCIDETNDNQFHDDEELNNINLTLEKNGML